MDDPAFPLVDPAEAPTDARRLLLLAPDAVDAWAEAAGPAARHWLDMAGFEARPGRHVLLPPGLAEAAGDAPATVLAVAPAAQDDAEAEVPWGHAGLPGALPPGVYRLAADPEPAAGFRLALGWALGAYRFERYRGESRERRAPARLVWPEGTDRAAVLRQARAVWWGRDLINTPAEHMGPSELEAAARALADRHGATVETVLGDELLQRNYPMIHTVGRASDDAPRLVTLRWGPADAPPVAILGKGVCFDTGGLDLKPAGGMQTMKKDMGGAASALGLAHMVMDARLRVNLSVRLPMAENAVAGNAFRPLDVLTSRQGLTVEVGNTDAEGRLLLADALAAAAEDKPALIVDFATLTGAQRVALGFELPALFANDDALAGALLAAGRLTGDPLWRLPLWPDYRRLLKSRVADISSTGESGFAGAITAALFLERFVPPGVPWAHVDHAGWSLTDRPGRPKGGEPQAMRAVFAHLAATWPPE